jgi:hypothetical protein
MLRYFCCALGEGTVVFIRQITNIAASEVNQLRPFFIRAMNQVVELSTEKLNQEEAVRHLVTSPSILAVFYTIHSHRRKPLRQKGASGRSDEGPNSCSVSICCFIVFVSKVHI